MKISIIPFAQRLRAVLGAAACLALSSCTPAKPTLWIYTSIYKEVIVELDPALQAALPGVRIEWYQGGSETIASKVNAELAAGRAKADLILTSDPFWYLELKKTGRLLPYESSAAKDIAANFRDPEHAFVEARLPVMVIAYNSQAMSEAEAPKSWKDLTQDRWKKKVAMPSPLESGTAFTTVALLSQKYGWEFFAELRKQDILAAGGNSSVITRIETRERPVGVVLLENVLKAWSKGSPVRPIYPEDGAIPITSPIAILKDTRQPELAKKAYDWFYSADAQNALVKSGMYSRVQGITAPVHAKPLSELAPKMLPWSPSVLEALYAQREEIKAKFSKAVLH
jgi:iron(III) transport system substrate-binding protein